MSTSENRRKRNRIGRTAGVYCGVTVFCGIFYLVYNRFSHGVHSPYMTWLFVWPLVLGVVPGVYWKWRRNIARPGGIPLNLYHSGVAAVTVSSMLRGIFEIAGTSSVYQEWLMQAGIIMLYGAILLYQWETVRRIWS
ncbi:MAG: hypothetical protein HDR08_16280 [Lachnospiraceae bacterium]|nr:hypothetical protein [Lachnospiraceae bacterium]